LCDCGDGEEELKRKGSSQTGLPREESYFERGGMSLALSGLESGWRFRANTNLRRRKAAPKMGHPDPWLLEEIQGSLHFAALRSR
jgi:hypothetical protein